MTLQPILSSSSTSHGWLTLQVFGEGLELGKLHLGRLVAELLQIHSAQPSVHTRHSNADPVAHGQVGVACNGLIKLVSPTAICQPQASLQPTSQLASAVEDLRGSGFPAASLPDPLLCLAKTNPFLHQLNLTENVACCAHEMAACSFAISIVSTTAQIRGTKRGSYHGNKISLHAALCCPLVTTIAHGFRALQ